MRKIAFTFIELLLAITLTGVVGTIAVKTVKPMDKNLKYAISNIYHNLDLAVYNGAVDGCSGFSDLPQPSCANTSHAAALCRGLSNYLTTTETSCDSNYLLTNIEDSFKQTPNLILSNGTRLFIVAANNDGEPFVHHLDNDGLPGGVNRKFYLIYADTNGKKGPNSMLYMPNSTHYPDIYAFAVVDGERAIPLGALEIDKKLLSSRVSFIMRNSPDATVEEKEKDPDAFKYGGEPVKYVDALAMAWGYDEHSDSNPRYTMVENPHSYNVLVREYLKENAPSSHIINKADNNLMSFVTNRCVLGKKRNASNKCVIDPISDDYGCKQDAVDACNISIDKFLF